MATATQDAAEQEERQDTGIDTGTLMGVLAGTFLIVIAIILGGDATIFVHINSMLIVVG
jgi:hypothetical protein